VDADTDRVGVHVALSDHEHGVDFHLFGALDFAVDVVVALSISARLDARAARSDRDRIFEHFRVIADWQDANLLGR
jgi:hypothetical protein